MTITPASTPLEVHGAEGPSQRPEPSLADRRAQTQQDAERDFHHGLDDSIGIVSRGGVLVGAFAIDIEHQQLQHEATKARRRALATDEQFIEKAKAEGVDGTSIAELQRLMMVQHALREETATARQHSIDILTGKAPDPAGRNLTGTVPEEFRPWRHNLAQHWLIALLCLLEAVPGFYTARMLLNSGDPVLAGFLAGLMAAALFGLPLLIGAFLAGPADPIDEPTRGETARRVVGIVIAAALWVAVVVLLASSRADDTRAVGVGAASGLNVTVPSAVLTCVFLGVGALIVWLHARINPHQRAVVAYNGALRRVDHTIERLQQRIDRSRAQVRMQELQRDATQDVFDHHIKTVLPAQSKEIQEIYRREYLRLAGDVDTTGAAMQFRVTPDQEPRTPPAAEPIAVGTFGGE